MYDHLYQIQKGKSMQMENRLVLARGWREGRMRSDCSWVQTYFLGDKNVLQLVVTVVQLCEYTKNNQIVYIKNGNVMVCELYLHEKNMKAFPSVDIL